MTASKVWASFFFQICLIFLCLFVGTLFISAPVVHAQDPFDGVSGSDISTDTDSTDSMALGDVDGDGDLDLVVGNIGTNKLYLNDGDSDPFTSVTAKTALPPDTGPTTSIALGDVDGDGRLDKVVGNFNQTNKLFLNDGDSDPFTSVTAMDFSQEMFASSFNLY